MTLLRRLALAALGLVGLAGTASAQYPQPPIRTFPLATPVPTHSHSHSQRPPIVIEQPVVAPPPVLVVQRPSFSLVVERPVLVPPRPQIPVYCLDTFARDFHPCPGKHHIAVIHPVTKQPVEVCFTLPDCKLRDLDVRRRSIEFDYGRHAVEIEFHRDGTACVHGG
jgi:hypothetical protein